jgi:ferredoxin
MRITVDDDRCAGHGMCVILCPEVFTLNDDGYAEAQMTDIPVEFETAVRDAIDSCPEHAITELK